MLERPAPKDIPDAPGSYQFYDSHGRVIYVGKARSLRQRLANYFQSPANLAPRTAQMVSSAARVEWIQVRNDVEALMLEYSLIKEFRPRFNVKLMDDKSYPWLAVTVGEEWPRPTVTRGRRRKGVRYFGPFPHAYAIRDTLDLLFRSFPIRSCSDAKFSRHQRHGRPCLAFHIERCMGPCTGEVDPDPYRQTVNELISVLEGDTDAVIDKLSAQMAEAAEALDFERAARLRDRLASVTKALERQEMVSEREESLDVVGLSEDPLVAAAAIFHVRHGRVVGRRAMLIDKVEDVGRAGLVRQVLLRLYGEPGTQVPPVVAVSHIPEDSETVSEWLTGLRKARVVIRQPKRGGKKALLETVEKNAQEELSRQNRRRAADHNARARALTDLQDALGMTEAPLRIECFDMSHLQGTDYVGSMVVMEDGLPKRSDYRRFKVKTVEGNDDYAAMGEVLHRRLSALLAEEASDKPAKGRFSYPPQLLLVDGGKGQLGVAVRVAEELGLERRIALASLAKQFEEVYLPNDPDPIRLPRSSEALYLLQRVRDEAHRFAISYHRQLRSKRMAASELEGVPGLGPARRKRLLVELGGIKGVKAASLEALEALPWLPDAVARATYEHIHGHAAAVFS